MLFLQYKPLKKKQFVFSDNNKAILTKKSGKTYIFEYGLTTVLSKKCNKSSMKCIKSLKISLK